MKLFSKIFFLFLISGALLSQEVEFGKPAFFFDAIVFKGDKSNLERLDIFTIVPGETLTFLKSENLYVAKYELRISLYDSLAKKLDEQIISGKIVEDEYYDAQGVSPTFDSKQRFFYVEPGKYTVQVNIVDEISKKEYKRSRTISVIDFNDFDIALSGLMLLSSIEEKDDGRYSISPHIDDNVGDLKDGFFVFFELYNNRSNYDSLDFIYNILDFDNKVLFTSPKTRREVKEKSQIYLSIQRPVKLKSSAYILQVVALKPIDNETYTENDYLAVTQRSLKLVSTLGGSMMKDLNLAIKQLRYAATQDEIDYVESAVNEAEKQTRFEEIWKKYDPSPNTERNEAYIEFYSRIEYADANFRSYTAGWMTDKGHVYVVFGMPLNINRYNSGYSDGRVYEEWVYSNNRKFVFADNTGLGDFRLVRPMTITEKYTYNK